MPPGITGADKADPVIGKDAFFDHVAFAERRQQKLWDGHQTWLWQPAPDRGSALNLTLSHLALRTTSLFCRVIMTSSSTGVYVWQRYARAQPA